MLNPSRSVRLLPLTLIAASLLLATKMFQVASALGGFSSAAMPIAEARAEAARPETNVGAPRAPELAPTAAAGNSSVHRESDRHSGVAPIPQRPAADATPPPTPQEIEILEQLASRRKALDAREQDLERQNDLLRAAEARLDQKLTEMKDLEATLGRAIKANDEQQQAKLRSLVKIYENMKPKDAARIFEELDMDTLLPVAERMNERKLAPVMAEMNPAKAKDVTRELAKLREAVSGKRPPAAG
jgi:flagellar motility protein MotE (MotC chaperone)